MFIKIVDRVLSVAECNKYNGCEKEFADLVFDRIKPWLTYGQTRDFTIIGISEFGHNITNCSNKWLTIAVYLGDDDKLTLRYKNSTLGTESRVGQAVIFDDCWEPIIAPYKNVVYTNVLIDRD